MVGFGRGKSSMLELDGELYVVDSYVSSLPFLGYIEKRYNALELEQWTANFSWASVVVAILYPVAVFSGIGYVKNREPIRYAQDSVLMERRACILLYIWDSISTVPYAHPLRSKERIRLQYLQNRDVRQQD